VPLRSGENPLTCWTKTEAFRWQLSGP
jgi:hypothetical protein